MNENTGGMKKKNVNFFIAQASSLSFMKSKKKTVDDNQNDVDDDSIICLR